MKTNLRKTITRAGLRFSGETSAWHQFLHGLSNDFSGTAAGSQAGFQFLWQRRFASVLAAGPRAPADARPLVMARRGDLVAAEVTFFKSEIGNRKCFRAS